LRIGDSTRIGGLQALPFVEIAPKLLSNVNMRLTTYVADDILESVAWEVEFSDEFGAWWDSLTTAEQESVDYTVSLLQELGPMLKMPHSSGIETSRHKHMRELRIQHGGRPYRVLYAFDSRRTAILLIGGDKTGRDRWYEEFVALADAVYDRHLQDLEKEE
jgi:hypothetical protein